MHTIYYLWIRCDILLKNKSYAVELNAPQVLSHSVVHETPLKSLVCGNIRVYPGTISAFQRCVSGASNRTRDPYWADPHTDPLRGEPLFTS